jgi:hypothetical protein
LTDSTRDVDGSSTVGCSEAHSRGALVLVNSTATVGAALRLGASANSGQLFGEAMPEVRSSLRTIGDLPVNAGARPGLETSFGTDRLAHRLGG